MKKFFFIIIICSTFTFGKNINTIKLLPIISDIDYSITLVDYTITYNYINDNTPDNSITLTKNIYIKLILSGNLNLAPKIDNFLYTDMLDQIALSLLIYY